MKAWIKRTLVGVFGASVVLGSLAGCSHRFGGGDWSQHTPEQRAEFRAKMVDRVASKLELDAAQKAKFEVLASTLQAQREAVMGATNPRDEMKALVAGTSFDRNRAQVLVQQKTQAVQNASPAVITAMADFYDSLKPEQQQKVRDFMNRRGGRGGPGHHGRG